jgi:hypothetical protein
MVIYFLGGDFIRIQTSYNTYINANYIVRYNLASKTFHKVGNGTNGVVNALLYKQVNIGSGLNNYLFVGGDFTQATNSDTSIENVNKITYTSLSDLSNITWNNIGGMTSPNASVKCIDMLLYPNVFLYVGGSFTQVEDPDNTSRDINNITYYNFDLQRWYPIGDSGATKNGTNNTVNTIAFDIINNYVYVGGSFNEIKNFSGSNSGTFIARWLYTALSATWDTTWSTNIQIINIIDKIIFDYDTYLLYIIGAFNYLSDNLSDPTSTIKYLNLVAIYNTTTETFSGLGSTPITVDVLNNGLVATRLYDISLSTIDGKKYLYVSGSNITAALNTSNYQSYSTPVNLIRWNITDSVWEPFGCINSANLHMISLPNNIMAIGNQLFNSSNIINVSAVNNQPILFNGLDYNQIQLYSVGSNISIIWCAQLGKWIVQSGGSVLNNVLLIVESS